MIEIYDILILTLIALITSINIDNNKNFISSINNCIVKLCLKILAKQPNWRYFHKHVSPCFRAACAEAFGPAGGKGALRWCWRSEEGPSQRAAEPFFEWVFMEATSNGMVHFSNREMDSGFQDQMWMTPRTLRFMACLVRKSSWSFHMNSILWCAIFVWYSPLRIFGIEGLEHKWLAGN